MIDLGIGIKTFNLKNILIISPHFPPSNLAAVHRSRLFSQHLPSFDWNPIILTVHEDYYEEKLDHNLMNLLPEGLRIEKVKAFPITKPRMIGDIGLRAFFQLRKKALEIVKNGNIAFVYIPIPSFYTSLIGTWLNRKTGVKYGIDYIDPWVHEFPGSDKLFTRHWFSKVLAKVLEPIALKRVSLVTGVGEGYYEGVVSRNPGISKRILFGAMPYGGEKADHLKVKELGLKPYLFTRKEGVLKFIYAGAMLPNAIKPLEIIFEIISKNRTEFASCEFYFIGTGRRQNNHYIYSVKPLAKKFGLWEECVLEYPERIPYLDVLTHLTVSDAIFILGSTEPHYTPSKVYQGVLSKKPIFAILHSESTAVDVLKDSKAGIVVSYRGESDLNTLKATFLLEFNRFKKYIADYNAEKVNLNVFESYSAKSSTKKLVELINRVLV